MNKKLKKMIAAASAVAMCATSVISMGANASSLFVDEHGAIYEEFTELGDSNGLKVTFNDEVCGYALKNATRKDLTITSTVFLYLDCYSNLNEEEAKELSEFLTENYPDILYECEDNGETFSISLDYQEEPSYEEQFQIAVDIYKNVNLKCGGVVCANIVTVKEIKAPLPEQTLAGDANEDGNTDIADAVYIMQTLSNPNDYKLTPQGMANADMDGNGVTAMDALTIQIMLLNQ